MQPQILTYGGARFVDVRSVEDPAVNVQLGQNPLLTALVLGQPMTTALPGADIMRRIAVDQLVFEKRTNGTTHLQPFDTLRPMRAPIKTIDTKWTVEPAKLRRHSIAALRDLDEIANAHPSLRLMETMGKTARTVVELSIERERRDILQNTANYPVANVLTLAAGDEFNANGGDSRAAIRSVGLQIQASTGISITELTVWLSAASLEAAKDDPLFLAARTNFTADTGDAEALARYWGVKRVWSSNPIEVVAEGEDASPMYGDNALIYYAGDAPDLDTELGELVFGATYSWNKGVAGQPFILPLLTSWVFPWHDTTLSELVNSKAGGIVVNCAA